MTTAVPDTGTQVQPADAPGREQLALVRAAVRGVRAPGVEALAAELPVARVALEVSLAHLDRAFDYAVPASMGAGARPGTRVRVRFAGRDVAGFVVARVPSSAHDGPLDRLRRVVSAEVVLTPAVLGLARAVADRYAGTLADVLRLAVPPRHAATELAPGASELEALRALAPEVDAVADAARWEPYAHGSALLGALAAGQPARAVWAALPGPQWAEEIGALVAATHGAGRGALVVAPDQRDVDVLAAALDRRLGAGRHVVLTAGLGPAERYRRFLAVAHGDVRVVLGTRAAAFAPVAELGLVLVWDDGDDSLAEQRAPYPHAREVALLRASTAGGSRPPAVVLGGRAVSAEGALLVRRGWALAVQPTRETLRERAPRVATPSARSGGPEQDPLALAARLPTGAWQVARDALERGPVLVQVPRVGYVPALACAHCRASARCPHCQGPLLLRGAAVDAAVHSAGDAAGDSAGDSAVVTAVKTVQAAGPAAGPAAVRAIVEPGVAGPPGAPRQDAPAAAQARRPAAAQAPRPAEARAPRCRWCGVDALAWRCSQCGDRRLRALRVGAERTAEELGRAFPRVRVVQSTGQRRRTSVGSRPALVVATPGAEPLAEGGYAAALLLDAAVSLSRPALRAQEESFRRWIGAAALVRPQSDGGAVVVVADPALPVVQALVRWDPFGAADTELADRGPLGLPPTARVAVLSGEPAVVGEALGELRRLLEQAGVLAAVRIGPVLADETPARALVRAPHASAGALSRALAAVQARRTARRATAVRVQVDPPDLA